ncbi:MAG: MFS transporter [Candidatus Lokiarchaeota archaeon]|nr:MFS transporter [Candidatus Lokiarchaeota archaeon]
MQLEVNNEKYKANIRKSYIFNLILGIHTVRGIYIPYMTDWGQLTFFEIMLLQSYFTFVIFLLEIPSGAIADFIGRKPALSLSALSIAFAAILYSIIPNFLLFIFAETLWGLGLALMSGTEEAFLYNTLRKLGKEDKLPKILARNRTMNLIALTLSAPIGSIIAVFISLQFAMTCLAFVYMGAFIASLTFKEPIYKEEYKSERYLNIIKDGFKELKKNKILRILCFDRLLINVLIFLLFWTYQPYLQEINVHILFFGLITSMMNIVNVIFINLIPKFGKWFKSKIRLLILFNLITGFSYIFLGLTTNVLLGIVIILIIVAFGYPRYLLYVNGINSQVESENRATILSTVNMFGSLIQAIIYPFIGIIVMWNIYAFFIIIGISIIILTIFTRVKNDYL